MGQLYKYGNTRLDDIIEGEEEVGSSHLEQFVNHNTALLKADVIVVVDTALYA